MNERLTTNFQRFEFACDDGNCRHCGGVAPINPEVVFVAQALRDALSQPLTINSGFRCRIKNISVGGTFASQHLNGNACDIAKPEGITIAEMRDIVEPILGVDKGGLGLYDNFIHIDVRQGFWRGDNRTVQYAQD